MAEKKTTVSLTNAQIDELIAASCVHQLELEDRTDDPGTLRRLAVLDRAITTIIQARREQRDG